MNAADEIERLQADAHALAAERLCRAVEVAVLLDLAVEVAHAYHAALDNNAWQMAYPYAEIQLDHGTCRDAVSVIDDVADAKRKEE